MSANLELCLTAWAIASVISGGVLYITAFATWEDWRCYVGLMLISLGLLIGAVVGMAVQ